MLITDASKVMELVCPEAKVPYHGGYTAIGLFEDGIAQYRNYSQNPLTVKSTQRK